MSDDQLKRKLKGLYASRNETIRKLILDRSGSASNVREAGVWADKTLLEAESAEIAGIMHATKAVK